jgi:ligand-binding sensor domain-containing protein/two-component sensor histidine kinase
VFLRTFILHIIFLLLLVKTASARFPHLIFKNLNTQNGLSYNLINCLLEDSEGYIWAGTFSGLNRFDGTEFTVFKSDRNNPNSLIQNNVLSLCDDKKGNIWIATAGGVSRYNKATNSFHNYLLDISPKAIARDNDVSNILCDRQGRIWCATISAFYEYLPATDSWQRYQHNDKDRTTISANSVQRNAMVEDPRRNCIWLGTGKGLNMFDTEKKVFYHYRNNPENLPIFTDHNIVPVAFDKKGNLSFGDFSKQALVTYNTGDVQPKYSEEPFRYDPKSDEGALSCLFIDSENNYWYSTWDNTIQVKNGTTNEWIRLKHDANNRSSINSDFFWDMIEARDGTIYIGGLYGLSIYRPVTTFYEVFRPAEEFHQLSSSTAFSSFYEDENGLLWIGNDGEGLVSYDFANSKYTQYKVPGSRAHNLIFHISNIGNELWLTTARGIQIFDKEQKTFTRFDKLPPSEHIDHEPVSWAYRDKQHTIWFAIRRRGLYHYFPQTGKYERFQLDSTFISPQRSTIVKAYGEDSKGHLWFGTYSGVLYEFDPFQRKFIPHIPDPLQRPVVLQRPVNGIHVDKKNIVWMVTEGGGLVKYDPSTGKFKSWMESDGIALDVCNNILADKSGKLWVGSYEGVTIFDPTTEKIENPKIDYGQRENNFFSRGSCILKNGNIVFANGNNFIMINPSQVTTYKASPKAVISGIKIFETSRPLYEPDPRVKLSYRENYFTINFSVIQAVQESAIEYAYQLLGYDKEWVYSGNRSFASYTGVKGGNYKFLVKARYKEEKWGNTAMIDVQITPPFYETWWFRLIGLLALGAAIYGFIKVRERRIINDEQLKSDFRQRVTELELKSLRSQMNPHFLYNSLNAIRLFVLQNEPRSAEKYLVKFSRLMRLILHNSRQETVTLESELELNKLYLELEQVRLDNKFDFEIQTDEGLRVQEFLVPPMIVQPYIENAILHGIRNKQENGHIKLAIAEVENGLKCIIEDDGVGREKAAEIKNRNSATHNGVALKVTEERLQLIGQLTGKLGAVEFEDLFKEDGTSAGTRVIIIFPKLITTEELAK